MLKVIGASWFQTRVGTCIVGTVSALGILAIILGEIDIEEDDGIYSATVFWSENAGFHIDFWGQGNELEEIPYGVGRAYYQQDINTTGWAVLELETRSEYPDWVQAFSAGLLEGSLTWQLIYWYWQNTVQNVCKGREDFCNSVRNFIEENSDWLKDTAEKRRDGDPFWHQVQLFYVQLDGLETGWRHGVKRSRQEIDISHRDFLWMNMVSDLPDMEQHFNSTLKDADAPFMFSAAASFASAFIKFHADTGELYAAHNSGGLYQSMLRILKRYQLGYHYSRHRTSKLVPGQIITFSSYPGVIYSQDDFYLITRDPEFGKKHHQLAVVGTAYSNYNRSCLTALNPEEQVLSGPRVMAANRLATEGRFWGHYLKRASSGTGSKQWLIVDYGQISGTEKRSPVNVTTIERTVIPSKLFSSQQPEQQTTEQPITKLPIAERRGLLWVVEQVAGLVHSADQTRFLQHHGFWISTGMPYYKNLSHACGITSSAENRRTQIFQYNQTSVANVTSVMQLMRNNTSLFNSHLVSHDNTSLFSFSHDLPPMGTIDTKIFIASPYRHLELHAISGPPFLYNSGNDTSDSSGSKPFDAPFEWSKFANEHLIGMPDLWHFNAVQPQWAWV